MCRARQKRLTEPKDVVLAAVGANVTLLGFGIVAFGLIPLALAGAPRPKGFLNAFLDAIIRTELSLVGYLGYLGVTLLPMLGAIAGIGWLVLASLGDAVPPLLYATVTLLVMSMLLYWAYGLFIVYFMTHYQK